MAIVPLVGLEDKLWMVGQKSVWSSRDGIHWDAQAKTNWGERAGMAFAFFKGKLWMAGGMRAWHDFRNDVWCSDDGKEWEQVIARAPWPARRNHAVVVFNERLWVLGGAQSSVARVTAQVGRRKTYQAPIAYRIATSLAIG
jgi:hypothetical protein